jgi:Flp pilus assembly protein TadD
MADYTKTIALKPNGAEAYHNRGVIYEKKGLHEKAIADYRSALRLDPNNNDSKRALERLEVAP